jgi:hypothetical protein
MQRFLRGRLLAAAMVLTSVPLCATVPAYAQVSISFDSFHGQLARYGNWVYSDRWGTVWQPGDVPNDFRPYDTGGHWEYTGEYGWTWISDYAWGDVAFHYGRWVYDPDDGWLWMPGYVWSPAWVVWRGNNDYVGWMPMPPDDNFLSGRGDIGVSASWNDPDRYYSNWYGPRYGGGGSLWVFVNFGHIADRDYHRYAARRDQVPMLVRQTTNITNYTVVNNYVVNRSIDVQRVSRAAGHPIRPVAARTVFKHPDMISTVARGDQMRARMINEAPRGMGKPNSAPPPPQAIINKLSDHAVSRGEQHGGQAKHLFTKSALTQPGAATQFRGGNAMQNNAGPGGQEGPHAKDSQNHPMNAGPVNGMNGPQKAGGETGQPNGRSPDKAMNGPGSANKMHPAPAAKIEHEPASALKPDSGPAGGATNGPSNAAGPDNGGPRTHGNKGAQTTTGPGAAPDNGPATGGPRHRSPPTDVRPAGGPDNGAANGQGHRGSENVTGPAHGPAVGTRREIGPPAMEGPGPGPKAQAHENGPPANGAAKAGQEKERGPRPKKDKEQNPPQ